MSGPLSFQDGLAPLFRRVGAGLIAATCLSVAHAQSFREQGVRAMKQGDYPAAIAYYEKALATAKKVLKESDLELVICRAELGEAYRAGARWDDAIAQLDYAWKRVRYDAQHNDSWLKEEGELAVRYGEALGRACQGAARYNDAVMVFTYMISDAEQSKRDETELIQPCALMADTLLLMKRYGEADIYIQKAVTIAVRRHAGNAAVQATVFAGLADIYVQHCMYEKAKPLAMQALEMTTRREEPDMAYMATLQTRLGGILAKLGDLDSAQRMLDGADAYFSQKMTPDSEKFMAIQLGYSNIALQRNQPHEALAFATEAFRLCKLHYPPDHPEMARYLEQLAACYGAVNDSESALAALKLALAISEKALGRDHPLTQQLRLSLPKEPEKVDAGQR